MKLSRNRFVAGFSLLLLSCTVGLATFAVERAIAANSQFQYPPPKKDNDANKQKNLSGQVVDKSGKGLAEAVVYLKDKKSLAMKTHISDDKGSYRFSGLDPNTDYEVHAEYKGTSSAKRSVSSFDDRKEVYLALEVNTGN